GTNSTPGLRRIRCAWAAWRPTSPWFREPWIPGGTTRRRKSEERRRRRRRGRRPKRGRYASARRRRRGCARNGRGWRGRGRGRDGRRRSGVEVFRDRLVGRAPRLRRRPVEVVVEGVSLLSWMGWMMMMTMMRI
ncbi:hypothetical protein N0V85_005794, partial [Neurospora sp. IMI 360204]